MVQLYDPELESDVLGVITPEGPEAARREFVDALVEDRESCPLNEKKRRVDELRFGGDAKSTAGGETGGELGPRIALSFWIAASHSVHGCVCDSPMWPHLETKVVREAVFKKDRTPTKAPRHDKLTHYVD
jgi:hypothetical protein